MNAETRREQVLAQLKAREKPISATALAGSMGVSRQIIVGDIALLRAQGHDIIATARGYTMTMPVTAGRFVGKIACRHTMGQTGEELLTIVRLGGTVLDVVVEHELYGEMTGQLNIAAPADVDAFLEKLGRGGTRLLSELTGGVHLHTVACRDGDAFARIKEALGEKNLLYPKD